MKIKDKNRFLWKRFLFYEKFLLLFIRTKMCITLLIFIRVPSILNNEFYKLLHIYDNLTIIFNLQNYRCSYMYVFYIRRSNYSSRSNT